MSFFLKTLVILTLCSFHSCGEKSSKDEKKVEVELPETKDDKPKAEIENKSNESTIIPTEEDPTGNDEVNDSEVVSGSDINYFDFSLLQGTWEYTKINTLPFGDVKISHSYKFTEDSLEIIHRITDAPDTLFSHGYHKGIHFHSMNKLGAIKPVDSKINTYFVIFKTLLIYVNDRYGTSDIGQVHSCFLSLNDSLDVFEISCNPEQFGSIDPSRTTLTFKKNQVSNE